VGIHIEPLYLAAVVAMWIAVYHVTYGLIGIARNPTLVCWSVGPFGVSVIALRQSPARRIVAQLAVAAATLASIANISLYVVEPPPIRGLGQSLTTHIAVIAIPVVALTLAHLWQLAREHRYPLWGEARVLAAVQRSLATGAHIFFTPMGRAFVRERFGATPPEFLQMVRY
jgi:hypothetical protein